MQLVDQHGPENFPQPWWETWDITGHWQEGPICLQIKEEQIEQTLPVILLRLPLAVTWGESKHSLYTQVREGREQVF